MNHLIPCLGQGIQNIQQQMLGQAISNMAQQPMVQYHQPNQPVYQPNLGMQQVCIFAFIIQLFNKSFTNIEDALFISFYYFPNKF